MTKWTELDFENRVGRAPDNDDLDRVNCGEAGTRGHRGCGVCEKHNLPMFTCNECFSRIYNPLTRNT